MEPLPPSTTSEVLSGKRLPRLPRLEFVESYVTACLSASGLDEPALNAEVARWRELWRAVAAPERLAEPAGAGRPDRSPPRRPLTLLVVVFVAGLGGGIAGTLGWTRLQLSAATRTAVAEPSAEAPDVCLPPATALPQGQDVLQLPPAGQRAGSWWVNEARAAALSTDGRQFRADVTAGTSRPGDVIIVKSDIALVQGRSYALSFAAAADRATTIRVRVQDSRPPAYQDSYDREVSVDQNTCLHRYQFVAKKTSAHSELTFQVGGRPHDFRLEVRDTSLTTTLD